MVDLPFALPTAVAGISLTALFSSNGWFGSILSEAGIKVAYTPVGIMIAMCSPPAFHRAYRAARAGDLDPALEEAAQSLGGSDWTIFARSFCPC